MRVVILTAVAAVALLAGCSQGSPEPAEAPAAAAPMPAVLGETTLDQPLHAVGTEPFWGLDITPGALVYSGVDRPEQRVANPGPTVQGTTAVYEAETDDGTKFEVTLIATECSDGMSDRTYPLTVRLEIGEETLNGCAAPQASFAAQPPA